MKVFHKRYDGQGSVELLMTLLIFIMMLGTLMSISFYLYLNNAFWTAAKEGARAASVDQNFANTTTVATGVTDVQTWVINFVQNSIGITIPASDITVTGPTGAVIGSRTMQVTISYQFQNPVAIRTFINKLGGGNTTGLDTFTISSTATMRYEE